MKFIDKIRLRKLLIKQANPLLCQTGVGPLANYSVGRLDRLKAINVYSIKEELSNNRYDTFPTLIAGLNVLDDKHVKIHSFNAEGKDFILFTNVSVKKIIGYICPSVVE